MPEIFKNIFNEDYSFHENRNKLKQAFFIPKIYKWIFKIIKILRYPGMFVMWNLTQVHNTRRFCTTSQYWRTLYTLESTNRWVCPYLSSKRTTFNCLVWQPYDQYRWAGCSTFEFLIIRRFLCLQIIFVWQLCQWDYCINAMKNTMCVPLPWFVKISKK